MLPIGIRADFENLPDARALGFDFVEISLSALSALPESDFQEFAAYAAATELKVTAASDMLPGELPITGPRVNATELHAYLKGAFERAKALGVRVVCLDAGRSRNVAPDGDYPFAWRQLGNFLRLAQGHASECGIVIALEPLRKADCRLLNLVSEATLIAGLLQLGNVGVAAHWGSMAMASEPVSALRRAAPLLRHVHVENALTRRLPAPGDGEDYARLIRALVDAGYVGGVSLCAEKLDDFAAEAEAALRHMRAICAGAEAQGTPVSNSHITQRGIDA